MVVRNTVPRVQVLAHPGIRGQYAVFVNGEQCPFWTSSCRRVYRHLGYNVVVKVGWQSEQEAAFWDHLPDDKRDFFAEVLASGVAADRVPWVLQRYINGDKPVWPQGEKQINALEKFGACDLHTNNYLMVGDNVIVIDYGIPTAEKAHELQIGRRVE